MEFLRQLDELIFLWINKAWTNPFFDAMFPAITDLHKTWGFRYIFVPLLLILTIYFMRLKGGLIIFGLALALGLADKIGSIGKRYWLRPRPFQDSALEVIQRSEAGHFAFPSNHAANMFAMAFFLSRFFPKFRWLFFTIAILVSLSRIYNGVHYPFDVLGGALVGTFFGILMSEITVRAIRQSDTYFAKKRENV